MNKYRIPPLPHHNKKHVLRGVFVMRGCDEEAGGVWSGSCRTQRTHLEGMFVVSSVREWGEEAAKHRKHAHVGMFSMFSMSAMVGKPLDTKNTSRGHVFRVQHEGVW